MGNITKDGILHKLTKEEFELLPYIDGRMYLTSATARFSGWGNPFDPGYLDWARRIEIQKKLSKSLQVALEREMKEFQEREQIKVIYLGAALGSISSYFSLAVLKKYGLLNKAKIFLYDLLPEPLALTKQGLFEFSEEAARSTGLLEIFSPTEYKSVLADCEIVAGNITSLPEEFTDFDIAVAPYIHHHLNVFDKRRACQEMQRILRRGGIALIGDLTFDYDSFSSWLAYHSTEDLSYALESFVSLEEHWGFFKNPKIMDSYQGDIFYNFSLTL